MCIRDRCRGAGVPYFRGVSKRSEVKSTAFGLNASFKCNDLPCAFRTNQALGEYLPSRNLPEHVIYSRNANNSIPCKCYFKDSGEISTSVSDGWAQCQYRKSLHISVYVYNWSYWIVNIVERKATNDNCDKKRIKISINDKKWKWYSKFKHQFKRS